VVDGLGKWAGPKKLAGKGANPSDMWLEPRGMLQKGFARKPGGWNEYRRKHKAEGTWRDGDSARPVDVWTIATKGFKGAHFATFPEALVEMCIKPGCPPGGIVLDPFAGSGTTCVVAKRLGRHFVGVDLKPKYVAMAMHRLWPDLQVDVKNLELAESRRP